MKIYTKICKYVKPEGDSVNVVINHSLLLKMPTCLVNMSGVCTHPPAKTENY